MILISAVGCASNPPPPMTTPAPTAAPASTSASAPAGKARTPEAILADAVAATGGAAAWNAHKTAHFKMETTLQGMGMGGHGERFQTHTDKSLTVLEMAGIGRAREGTNGKVAWTDDPLQGIRYLEGTEAEQARIGSAWNPDMSAGNLFVKLESATEPGPAGVALECVIATPKLGQPLRSCYDARTHLQVSQSGIRATPQGDVPFRATLGDWRDVGGVKIPFQSDTQVGPITSVDRVLSVTFDEPLDEKMFDPPKPGQP